MNSKPMNVAIINAGSVRQLLAAFAIFALMLSTAQGIFISVASADNSVDPINDEGSAYSGQTNVTICHSGNGKNYTDNSPNVDSIVQGNSGHDNDEHDIIPAFYWNYGGDSGFYHGKNWDAEGQDIWANESCDGDGVVGPTTGTITIEKTVTNDDDGQLTVDDFTFYVDGVEVDEGTATTVPAGTYTVSEDAVEGYTASDWGGDCDSDGSITVEPGTDYTCTIENDDDTPAPTATGTLQVTKVIFGETNSTSDDFSFQIDGGSATAFESDGDNEIEFDAGTTVTVTEVAAPGFNTTYDNCTEVTITEGQTETCTITNTVVALDLGSISGTKFSSDEDGLGGWTIFIDGNNNQTLDEGETSTVTDVDGNYSFGNLEDGSYSVCEVEQNGWEQLSPNSDNGCHAVTIVEGSDESDKDFINREIPLPDDGTIVVEKLVTDGSSTTQEFTFSPSWGASFTLADGESENAELTPDTYSVSETVPSGWTLESAVCVHGDQSTSSPDSIELSENETVTCIFTNDEDDDGGGGGDNDGTIIVEKEVTDGSSTTVAFTFSPSWGSDFALADGESESSDLASGTYSVSETVPEGWNLDSAVCVHGDESTSTPDSIDLASDETVTCTFVNDEVEENTTPSCDISASTLLVDAGGEVTLEWESFDATSAELDGDSVALSGTTSVTVDSDTTYTLEVMDDDEETSTCSVTVEVREGQTGGSNLSCSISTNDPLVDDDDEFTLSWSSSGSVDNAFINAGVGSVNANGSKSLFIEDDTTFILTVQDLGEEDEVLAEETCVVEVKNRGGGGGGGTRIGGGGNSSPDGEVLGESTSSPEPEVLGEQVSVVPEGAASAGAGGAAPQSPMSAAPYISLLFGNAVRVNRNAK